MFDTELPENPLGKIVQLVGRTEKGNEIKASGLCTALMAATLSESSTTYGLRLHLIDLVSKVGTWYSLDDQAWTLQKIGESP